MPTRYTSQEYANMHLIYGECRCNASATAILYRERYTNLERYPDHCVFFNVHRSLTEGGHFPNQIRAGGRPCFPYEEEVLQEVADDPNTSVRGIEERSGIPKSTAHRILQRAEMHPFHVQRVQSLLPRDYPERISFCRTMLQRHNENPQFIHKNLWSDESTFTKDGYINLHNFHEWHVENPHLMREDRSQYRFKVNLWTGILNGKIVGPFELPENLNGTNYLHFLRENLPTLLEDVPLTDRCHIWYQQDGCPAHYAVQVRDFLDQEYPGRWKRWTGPTYDDSRKKFFWYPLIVEFWDTLYIQFE